MTAAEFAREYQENYGKLFYYVMGLAKNTAIAEDVVSQAFLNAWEHRQALRGDFKPWLYQIATNVMKKLWRRESYLQMEPLEGHEERRDAKDFTQELERFMEWQRAAQAATTLSHPMRLALAHHLRGLTIAKSARQMRVAPGTAGTRLWNAKKIVRELCHQL